MTHITHILKLIFKHISCERYQSLSEEEKEEKQKKLETDIKIFLKKKNKKAPESS